MSAHPLIVTPPANGLGSFSNYILSNQCNHITGLVVTIDVTQDLVLKSSANADDYHGFTFQLNCYSATGFDDAWQQYAFALLYSVFPYYGPAALNAQINNWPAKGNYFIDEMDLLIGTGGTTIPAGYQLQIRLLNDNQDNVVGAHWIVNYIGVLPAPTTPLTGYVAVDNAGNTEPHLNYIGTDGHVHERPATLPRYDNDLSVLAGGSIFPAPNSALDAYADLDGGQHVNFIGTDGHVHELYLASGGHWIDNDLTQLAQLSGDSVPPVSGSPLDGYVDNDRAQHVNFIGTDGHVHELLIKPNGHWIDNDLIVKSGNGVTPRLNSPLDGYVDNDNGQHVNFIGTDGHVHELYIKPKGQWINNDLIILSGNGIAPSRISSLCGYMAQDNGQHVNFIGTDGHIHELYNLHSAQWLNNDLTQLAQLSGPSVPTRAQFCALRLVGPQRQAARQLHRHRRPRPRPLHRTPRSVGRQRPHAISPAPARHPRRTARFRPVGRPTTSCLSTTSTSISGTSTSSLSSRPLSASTAISTTSSSPTSSNFP
jgi:hypothetical protein